MMWDYTAYPLWSDLSVPVDLASSLQAWSDEGTERFSVGGGSLSDEWCDEWVDRGRSLAREVARVTDLPVEYWNQATGKTEMIVSADT